MINDRNNSRDTFSNSYNYRNIIDTASNCFICVFHYFDTLNRSVYTKLQYQLRERLQDKLAMRSKSEARDKILKIQNGNCLPCNFIGLQSNREDWKAYIE